MSNISLLKPLIIATESEIRKKIFSDFNLNVNFIASEVDEDSIKENFQFKNYYDLAIELASAKALEISKKILITMFWELIKFVNSTMKFLTSQETKKNVLKLYKSYLAIPIFKIVGWPLLSMIALFGPHMMWQN